MNPAGAGIDIFPVAFEIDDHGAAADFAVVVHFGGDFVDSGEGNAEALETGWADDFVDFHVIFAP